MTRRFVPFSAVTFALLLLGVALWVFALYTRQGSIFFHFGMLPTSKDEFLDGSGRTFQQGSWHFGNALRTWGETYDAKFGPGYLTLEVTHIASRYTKAEAKEE